MDTALTRTQTCQVHTSEEKIIFNLIVLFDVECCLFEGFLWMSSLFERVRLVSSGSFHWTRLDSDTCPRVDKCPQSNVSSGNFH